MYILPNFMADQITRITENLNPMFITIKHNIIQLFRRDSRQQKQAPFLPHAAFAFTMFVLPGFLQVKYQGKNESPFESNPNITSLSVVSLLLYCFFYAVEQRPKTSFPCRRLAGVPVGWCMSVAGLLSASLLFPDFFRPMIFELCFVIVAAEQIRWVYIRVSRERTQSEKVANCCKELFMDISRPLARFFTDHHHRRRQMLPL